MNLKRVGIFNGKPFLNSLKLKGIDGILKAGSLKRLYWTKGPLFKRVQSVLTVGTDIILLLIVFTTGTM